MTGGPPSTITAVDGPAAWRHVGTGCDHHLRDRHQDDRTTARGRVQEESRRCSRRPNRERGEGDHRFPEFLPGGKAVRFTITSVTGGVDGAHIAVLDLQTSTYKNLMLRRKPRVLCADRTPTLRSVGHVASHRRSISSDLKSSGHRHQCVTAWRRRSRGRRCGGRRQRIARLHSGRGGRRRTADGHIRQSPGTSFVAAWNRGLDSYRDVRVSPDGKLLALATQDDIWISGFVRGSLDQADGRPGVGHQSAVDPGLAAHHLYVKAGGVPAAVFATGRWHGRRRAGPHAGDGS